MPQVPSHSDEQDTNDPKRRKVLEKHDVEKKILNDLEALLKGGWQESDLKVLPENYFYIDDILKLPKFSHLTWGELREATHSDSDLRFSVRGSKIRLKPPELNKDPDVILSKKLAWILRHGAENEGLQFEDGGYIHIDDMMRVPQFGDYSFIDVKRVVDQNDKKRFEIRASPQTCRLQIRASQGHSIKVEGLNMRLIDDPYEFKIAIHGTYFKNWQSIKEDGLKRMGRTHIHFAPGEVGEEAVISGMRSSAEVLIYLDIAKAMADGIQFHISQNNVILSEGDQTGTITPKYFKAAYQRKPHCELPLSRNEPDLYTTSF